MKTVRFTECHVISEAIVEAYAQRHDWLRIGKAEYFLPSGEHIRFIHSEGSLKYHFKGYELPMREDSK